LWPRCAAGILSCRVEWATSAVLVSLSDVQEEKLFGPY